MSPSMMRDDIVRRAEILTRILLSDEYITLGDYLVEENDWKPDGRKSLTIDGSFVVDAEEAVVLAELLAQRQDPRPWP